MEQVFNDGSAFARLDINELHMLFRTHVTSRNNHLGLMNYTTKNVFFLVEKWYFNLSSLASQTKRTPVRFSEKNQVKVGRLDQERQ